jgi:hypothetical protein
LPIKLESPNKQVHWRVKNKINQQIHKKLLSQMPREFDYIELPCTIKLIRIAPRKFDYDNLVFGFKKIRDVLADFLLPNLAAGRADSDERMTWEYAQESKNGEYGVKIYITY